MSVADNAHTIPTTQERIEQLSSLFTHITPEQVEVFYKNYQHWLLEHQVSVLQEQLATLEQQIVDNSVLMQLTQPSPIALATLTRLQSCGVDDVDLLDRMLERGDTWLDHTLQLLEQCECLNFIHDNYTEWCQHALEGAYEWLDSVHETETVLQDEQALHKHTTAAETTDTGTEALLIQKLMSEDKTLAIPSILSYSAKAEILPEESIEPREALPAPLAPIHASPVENKQQKSSKSGLISRLVARVWQT
ncbi:MAG: hypothetical protein NVS4B12_00700 [Ktedonobacteraceae bacterium]